MRCARLLAHALQCIFIRAQRSAAAEDRGGRQRGERGVGVGGWREEGVKGMKGKKSGKQRTAFVTEVQKKGGCESDLWKHSGEGGAGVGGGL